MTAISWERPGIRVLQGQGPNGVQCWINWHMNEVVLGDGLSGPPILGGEYTAYIDGDRVGGAFGSLSEAQTELEKALGGPAVTSASSGG